MIFLALTLTLVFAILMNALWKHASRPAYVVGIYLLAFAEILIVSQAAGLLHALNNRTFFLASHFVLAIAALALWLWRGKPPLAGPFGDIGRNQFTSRVRRWIKTYPDLAFLLAAVALIYGFGIYLVLAVPPNNGDALWHHLTRIGYWLQQGSYLPWNTYSVIAQTTYPINAQTLMLWTMLFWGSDQLAGFVQWITVPVTICSIYGLGCLLGWRRPQALFAALIWASFPIVVLESTSSQNHLVASALLAAMIYTAYLAFKTGKARYFILSGISLGLGMGTFVLILMALPGLVLCAGLFIWKYRREAVKPILIWGLAGALGFLFLGAYIYLQNFLIYHNPLGANIVKDNVAFTCVQYAPRTILRHLYTAIDVDTGLPPYIANHLHEIKEDFGAAFFNLLNVPINVPTGCILEGGFHLANSLGTDENNAYYGLPGTLLLLPGMFMALWQGVKRRDVYRLGILILPLGIYVYIFSYNWQISFSRYFLLIWTMSAPFMAIFYRPDAPSIHRWLRELRFKPVCAMFATILISLILFVDPPVYHNGVLLAVGMIWLLFIILRNLDASITARFIATVNVVVILLAVLQMVFSLFLTPSKSLAGVDAIWGRDRIGLQTIWYKEFEAGIRMVEAYVPQDAALGLVLEPGQLVTAEFEYPFFGEHLTRRLIHVYPYPQNFTAEWLEKNGIRYVLVNYKREPYPSIPKGYALSAFAGNYYLYSRTDGAGNP